MSGKISDDTVVNSLPVGAYWPIVDPNEANSSDRNKRLVPNLTAIDDVDDGVLPAANIIGSISLPANGSISDPPTQAEVEALRAALETLRDHSENLRTVIANQTTTIEALRDRLKRTGGIGFLPDS